MNSIGDVNPKAWEFRDEVRDGSGVSSFLLFLPPFIQIVSLCDFRAVPLFSTEILVLVKAGRYRLFLVQVCNTRSDNQD